MKIDFGMPILAELPDLEAHAALCASLGLTFIELNMNFPAYQIHALDLRKLHRIKETSRIGFTLHLDEQLDVCSFNRLTARAWNDTVLQAIILAKQLTIPIVNMHLPDGIYVTLPEKKLYLYEKYRDDYLYRIQYLRAFCEQAIGDDKLYICIENTGALRDFQKEAIDLLLESPCFGLTYDIGHDFVIDGANAGFIQARAHRIKHLHIHDARKDCCHLTLGTGDINLQAPLQTAQTHSCRCVIETKTVKSLTESVAYLSQIKRGK